MVAVLVWLPLLSPAAAAAASSDRDALIASLEGLKKAVDDKIASDIDDVAWALWSVHEIEKARFLADLIGAPLAVIEQAIATVAAIRSVQDVEAGLANAYSTPLSFVAYIMGLSQLEQAGTKLQMTLDGPAYSSAVRALYDEVGKAQSPQGAAHALRLLLDPRKGSGGPLSIRAPEQARARGTPGFVHRPGDVRRFVAEALNQLARDLATGTLELSPPTVDALRGRIEQATAAIKRSKSVPLDVPPPPGSGRSRDISLGAIAGLRAAEGDLMAANARHLTAEAVSVKVKAVKAAGSAILLHLALDQGGRLATMQSSIVSVDSLAWGTVERSFASNVRELLAAVPQQMVLALGPELTNAWFIVEELVASIRSELEAPTTTAETSQTVLGEQVEITMGDGSVIKGQLEAAKVPFVSGYGTIEVETSVIIGFAEGRLALEDGSVLKGAFGDDDVALTTNQGALRIPAREIVAMSRTGTSEPTGEEALAQRIEDWLAGLESRVAALEAAPSEATWAPLREQLAQFDALEMETRAAKLGAVASKQLKARYVPSLEALLKRTHEAVLAPARSAAEAKDWQTVEVWADRILQHDPRDAEARSLKDQAVAARAAEAPSSAVTAAEPAPTKSIEKSATEGLAGGLSESEARRLIEQYIAAAYSPKFGGGGLSNIDVQNSKLWTSGAVYSLTHIDKCWPAQPPAKMLGWNEIACFYTLGCEPPPYFIEGTGIRVNHNGVAPNCTNVRGALLGQGGDGAWYAHRVEIVTHKPKLGKIVEILTRGDTARVSYTVDWKETAIYKKWAHDDPELMARYPAPSGDMHWLLKTSASLCKYDQGWRFC